ncbi:T9SS C-terminal target domain-containing protein [Rhodohalobacter sp. SW132]|nr:T9SS C-terminal target domain-containing protein [Rhodohalobacter sp. SW132]
MPAPTLQSPSNGSNNISLTPDFEWSNLDADHYILEVNGGNPSKVTVNQGNSITYPGILEYETTYSWRVRGVKDGVEGEWSAYREFTTEQAEEVITIASPVPASPENRGTVSTYTPTFEWSPVEGAEYYVLHSNRVDPAEMVVVEDVYGTSYTVPKPLDPGTEFHWRVHAVVDGEQGEWSSVWTFHTEEIVSLTAPFAVSPANELENSSTTPSFEWEAVEGAEHYVLHANRLNPAGMVIDQKVTGTSFQPADALEFETEYQWKVRAVRGDERGPWSSIRSFTTEMEEEVVEQLPVPKQVSPANHAVNVSLNPVFEWTASEGADAHQLTVIRSSDGETKIDVEIPGTRYTFSNSLEPEEQYTWRVRALQEDRQSNWSEERTFVTEPAKEEIVQLDIPEKILPAKDEENSSITPTFEWSAVDGADYYLIYSVSLNPGTVIADSTLQITGTTFTPDQPLEEGKGYEWQVRAVNGSSQSEWSEAWTFRTAEAEEQVVQLPAPKPISPANGGLETSLTPTFEWSAVDGADYYVLHSNRTNPSQMVVVEDVYGTSYTVKEPLDPETVHHWRVHAVKDGEKGEWTDIWEFRTKVAEEDENEEEPEEVVILPAPKLVSPINGSADSSLTPEFEWTAVEEADSYILHFGSTASSGSITDVTADETTFAVTDSLDAGTEYYWKVRAVKDDKEGEWSRIWTFETAHEEEEPEEIVLLPAPKMVSPVNGLADSGRTPEFTWEAVENADSYILHFGSTATPGSITDVTVEGTTFTVTDSLDAGSEYSWKVRAVNDGNEGEWSKIWTFETAKTEEPPVVLSVPKLIGPANNSGQSGHAVTFSWEAVEHAEAYLLHYGSLGKESVTVDVLVGGTELTLSDTLQPKTDYYWKVRAVNGDTDGEWSDIWSFATEKEKNNGRPVVKIPAPAQVAPARDAEESSFSTTFEWDEVEGADYYILHSVRLNPAELVIEEKVTGTSFIPEEPLEPESVYHWMVRAVTDSTESMWSEIWTFTTAADEDLTTSFDEDERPLETGLSQNYPNPFNPSTQIEFTLSEITNVSLRVYDLAGRQVAVLAEGVRQSGSHTITFRADHLSSGVYFYRFVTDKQSFTKKMTLIK